MRILVTGGAGFIGSHTVDALLREGHTVRVLDSLAPPVHEAGRIPSYVPIGRVDFIRGDVRDRSCWEAALTDIDAVIHLAAHQDYGPAFSQFFAVNAVGTALLYEVAVERRLSLRRVVVASSQSVYGEAKYLCPTAGCQSGPVYPEPRPVENLARREWDIRCGKCGAMLRWAPTDEAVMNPHNQYSLSKQSEESLALVLGRRWDIPTVAMRYSIVQGSRQSYRNAYSGVLRIFTQKILGGSAPICYEDGRQLRDYVSVHDVVAANLLVMTHPDAVYRSFNVGGDRHITVTDYARLIGRLANRDLEPETPGLYRFGDTRHVVSDVTRLRSLGWAPRVGLDEIVGEYLAWVRRQPDFADFSRLADQQMKATGVVRAAHV